MIFNSRRDAWMPLLLAAAMLAALVPVEVEALRTRRPEAVSFYGHQHEQQRTKASGDNGGNTLAFLASVPRGGADAVPDAGYEESTDSKGGVKEDVEEDVEDETEVEETVETVEEEIEAEVEELVEEVTEEGAEVIEAEVEELASEDSEADKDAAEAGSVEVEVEVEVEAADEEEVEVVYPTEEIISDDVRYFHTTDGELADDEGMYTDGQNESPIIADTEAAVDTIGVTRGGDGDASDDNEDDQEEQEDISTEATEATAVRTAAFVAIIDDDLKKVLMTDLRYTEADVSRMRPEIAKEVVYNKLSRPTEGMPKNWYTDPDDAVLKSSYLSHLAKKKGLIVSVAAVGVAAVVLKDNDAIGDTVEDMVDAVKSIPKALAAIVVAAKRTATRSPKPKAAATPKEEPQEEEDDEPETKDNTIHSIKPGTTPKEVPDPEADYTLLDKVLTGISGLVKKFFSIKI